MNISVIDNIIKYLNQLGILLGNGLIEDPTKLKQFVTIHMKNGEIIGWEIRDKKITFSTGDFLDCDELGKARSTDHYIEYFSYHFQPKSIKSLLSYRIDLDVGDLHFNPDSSLETKLKHRIPPEELPFSIENFNLLLAIHVAMKYISCCVYPILDDSGIYNKVIEGARRQIR